MSPGRRRPTPLLDALTEAMPGMTRDQLYRCVMCGEVRSGSQTLRDPRQLVDPGQPFTLVRDRYVSRGGEKLHAALTAWGISPAGRTWLDAGASTGGFTDCLLQGGARLVHAVDVGNNQLDYRLRRDGRVRVRERTNIMDVQELDPLPDAAVCDLSFRSLRGALRHILNLTAQGWGIALLKPQFEAAAEIRRGRRDEVESGGGVVGDDVRDDVVTGVIEDLLRHEGVRVMRQITSPLPGRQGNREELLLVGLVDVLNR